MNNVNSVLVESFVYSSKQRYFILANTRYVGGLMSITSYFKVKNTRNKRPAIGTHLRVSGFLESTPNGGNVYIMPDRMEKYNGETWDWVGDEAGA